MFSSYEKLATLQIGGMTGEGSPFTTTRRWQLYSGGILRNYSHCISQAKYIYNSEISRYLLTVGRYLKVSCLGTIFATLK